MRRRVQAAARSLVDDPLRRLGTASETMHITRWGSDGPRMVLVHGGAQGAKASGGANFRAQEPLAGEGWQLIVPDRPGHGLSPDPGRPDDAELDGALVMDLLGDGAHLIGHSFGACVALNAAARRPQAVRSLTFIEPALLNFASGDPRVRRQLRHMLVAMLFATSAVSRVKRIMNVLGIPPELYQEADDAELKRLGRGLRRVKIPAKATFQHQLETIKRAGIPLLVVTGGWSPGFDATGDIVAAAAHGRHVVVASPHHFPQWNGAAFNPVLTAFMTESDAKRAQSLSSTTK
jgi:pimeloyl-ACP methyl ester carboxylesterase